MRRSALFRLLTAALLVSTVTACALPSSGGRYGLHGNKRPNGLPDGEDGDPGIFKNLAAVEITNSLGDPTYRRREPPAEIWQYRGEGCILDLFLYDEGSGQKVAHAELRSRVPGQLPDAECLPKLLSGKRPGDANS